MAFRINSERLRQERLRRGRAWTQDFVGRKLGVSGGVISQFESGRCLPSIELLVGLCKLYGISADAVLGLASPPRAYRRATSEEVCEILAKRVSLWEVLRTRRIKGVLLRDGGNEIEVYIEEDAK